ncbi:hypothetical protein [Actinomadura nitritigenes]|uniref:hypothetical protein n=1 Tax=Actinomadura nitritigenes TaxID=134602 RepID=UPI003D8B954F
MADQEQNDPDAVWTTPTSGGGRYHRVSEHASSRARCGKTLWGRGRAGGRDRDRTRAELPADADLCPECEAGCG